MPLYDYHCEKCEQTREVIHRLSDPPKVACRTCGGEAVRRLSAPSFNLNGEGWYKPGHVR